MKIIKFEAENVKKLKAVQITPAGHMVEIAGKNGAGKTSILDSIWWALAGTRTHQPEPINRDHTKARIKLDLGELIVEREFKRQPPIPGKQDDRLTTRIKVTTAEGKVLQSPQTMLDHLLGSLSFDPLAFARSSEAEQYRAIQEICGIDLLASDRDNDADYTERRMANRSARDLRAAAGQIQVSTDIPERIDVAALVKERQRRERCNVARERIITRQVDLDRQVTKAEDAAEFMTESVELIQEGLSALDQKLLDDVARVKAEAKRSIEEMKRVSLEEFTRLGRQRDQYASVVQKSVEDAATARQALAALPEIPAAEFFSDIDDQTKRAEAVNETVNEALRQAARVARLTQEAEEFEAESLRLTEAIAARKLAQAAAVEKAQLPIPGLGLDNGQVTLNSDPFCQASDAEQLRASCAVAMRSDHELRVIRVRDGSLLDEDSMQILAEMATEADYQVWVERVSSSGQSGIYIEDGRVKG